MGSQEDFTLEELNLSGNTLADDTARVLAASLKLTISLTKLSLADTALQITGCQLICEAAKKSPLLELNLAFNKTTDMTRPLADFLKSNSKLCTLNLHSCGIVSEGVVMLAEGVRAGPQRKDKLTLVGIDFVAVKHQLQLPDTVGGKPVEWHNNDSIMSFFQQEITDRGFGLDSRRDTRSPDTRSASRPTTKGSGRSGSTQNIAGESEAREQVKTAETETKDGLFKAIEKIRSNDDSFTVLLVPRKCSELAAEFERATRLWKKAKQEAVRNTHHGVVPGELNQQAKEAAQVMRRAEIASEEEALSGGELRAVQTHRHTDTQTHRHTYSSMRTHI
jgi:hypothetical protein